MQDIVIYLTFLDDDRVGQSCTICFDSWSAYGLDLIFCFTAERTIFVASAENTFKL